MPTFGWYNHSYDDHGVCSFPLVMDYNYLAFLCFTTSFTPAIVLVFLYVMIYRVILRRVRKFFHQLNQWNLKHITSAQYCQIYLFFSSKTKKGTPDIHATISTINNTIISLETQRNTEIQKQRQEKFKKREHKATKNISIIVGFFMFCWVPLHATDIYYIFCEDCIINQTFVYSLVVLSHLTM